MAGSTAVPQRREPTADEFVAMQGSPEFQDLRSTFRGFTFPVMIGAFIWYVLYVLAATFAPDFMGRPLAGLNVGLAGSGPVLHHLPDHLDLRAVGQQEH